VQNEIPRSKARFQMGGNLIRRQGQAVTREDVLSVLWTHRTTSWLLFESVHIPRSRCLWQILEKKRKKKKQAAMVYTSKRFLYKIAEKS